MKEWTQDHPTLANLVQLVFYLPPDVRKNAVLIVGAGWAEHAAKMGNDCGVKCLIGMMDDPWSACLCMNCEAAPK